MRELKKSFLILNPFGIGDVLFSTPVIRNLKNNFPDCKIYYLCNKRTYFLLKDHPLLDRIFLYERDEFESHKGFAWLKKHYDFIREIRKERIATAVDLSLNTKFGFFCFLAGIRNRIGLDYKNRGRFLTRKLKIEGYSDKHVVEHYLDVLRLIDLNISSREMEIFPDKGSEMWAEEFFKKHLLKGNDLIIGVAPCGGEAFGPNAFMKRWPEKNFAEMIDRLISSHGAKILLFAGPKEKQEVGRIFSMLKNPKDCVDCSSTSLPQLVSLVNRCDLFIGNDTGPLRFANALQKKILAFFGPVDERVYGTYPFNEAIHEMLTQDLGCRPCYQKFRLPPCPIEIKCLTEISPDRAYAAAKKLLNL